MNFVVTMSGELCYVWRMVAAANRSEKLDLRLTPGAKTALKRAAESSRRSLSEFVLESALARADEVLADERTIKLKSEDWAAFAKALDAPAAKHPRLARLLAEPSVFD
jgi:uncharacterized protein (DUF1778 family)